MEKIKNAIMRFMQYRNGPDHLYYTTFYIYIALFIIYLITKNAVVLYLSYICIFYTLFRLLSKNKSKRFSEDQKYLALIKKVKSFFSLQYKRITDRKKYYHVCPYCKKVLRLPRIKGDHTVNCPVCHRDSNVHIR